MRRVSLVWCIRCHKPCGLTDDASLYLLKPPGGWCVEGSSRGTSIPVDTSQKVRARHIGPRTPRWRLSSPRGRPREGQEGQEETTRVQAAHRECRMVHSSLVTLRGESPIGSRARRLASAARTTCSATAPTIPAASPSPAIAAQRRVKLARPPSTFLATSAEASVSRMAPLPSAPLTSPRDRSRRA